MYLKNAFNEVKLLCFTFKTKSIMKINLLYVYLKIKLYLTQILLF